MVEKIAINVLNSGQFSKDNVNVIRNILLTFAWIGRNIIVQRTTEGKAIAKVTDPSYREGRSPKYDREQLDHAMKLLDDHLYSQVVKLTGISRSTLLRENKKRSIKINRDL